MYQKIKSYQHRIRTMKKIAKDPPTPPRGPALPSSPVIWAALPGRTGWRSGERICEPTRSGFPRRPAARPTPETTSCRFGEAGSGRSRTSRRRRVPEPSFRRTPRRRCRPNSRPTCWKKRFRLTSLKMIGVQSVHTTRLQPHRAIFLNKYSEQIESCRKDWMIRPVSFSRTESIRL